MDKWKILLICPYVRISEDSAREFKIKYSEILVTHPP